MLELFVNAIPGLNFYSDGVEFLFLCVISKLRLNLEFAT